MHAKLFGRSQTDRLLQSTCLDMSLFDKVTGELTFDKLYLFKMNFKWIEQFSSFYNENIARPTMSSVISDFANDMRFGVQFKTSEYVTMASAYS